MKYALRFFLWVLVGLVAGLFIISPRTVENAWAQAIQTVRLIGGNGTSVVSNSNPLPVTPVSGGTAQDVNLVKVAGSSVQTGSGTATGAVRVELPTNGTGLVSTVSFGTISKASITRSATTTTYTANTGWNNGTPTFFSFTSACRANGAQVLVPQIDIWSSANPSLKLTGILWLFSAVPGTNVSDNANFNIAAADYANVTGRFDGIPFTLAGNQGSGAANSGVSLTGTTYEMQCASAATTITGMVQVANAYIPANAEVLNVWLRVAGVN